MDIVQRAGDVKTYWQKHAVWGDAFAKSIFTRDRFFTVDNWFTSLFLALKLWQERRIELLGTVMPNRKGFPSAAALPKTRPRNAPQGFRMPVRGDMICMSAEVEGKRFYVTSWMDNKPVNFLSPFKPSKFMVMRMLEGANGSWQNTPVPAPTTAPVYNNTMGGTDLTDMFSALNDTRRRLQGRWQPRCE